MSNSFRFTTSEDKDWFESATRKVVKEHLGDATLASMADEPYFVDFLREAPEPTGEEPDDAVLEAPKVYELVRISLTPLNCAMIFCMLVLHLDCLY